MNTFGTLGSLAPLTLGAFLRSERERRKLRTVHVARALNCTVARVEAFEMGNDKPTLGLMRQLVRVFPTLREHASLLGGGYEQLGDLDPTRGAGSFGEALYMARDYFQTSIDTVAAVAKCSSQTVSWFEESVAEPTRDAYRALCDYFPCLESAPKPKSFEPKAAPPAPQRLVSVQPKRAPKLVALPDPPPDPPTVVANDAPPIAPEPESVKPPVAPPPAPSAPAPTTSAADVARAAMQVGRIVHADGIAAFYALLIAANDTGMDLRAVAELVRPEPVAAKGKRRG